MAGCRCLQCRAANSRYSCAREAARRGGDRRELVSTIEVRQFIKFLGKKGVGYKSVAAAASLAKSTVAKILSGERKHIRRDSAARILALGDWAVADRALIDATHTWHLIDQLVSDGYTKQWLASKLGVGRQIQFNRRAITAASASKVERLYRLIQEGRISR